MSQPSKSAKDIFLMALDVAPSGRTALLDVECGEDVELRRQVEALLKVHDEPDSLLDCPRIDVGISAPQNCATLAQPIGEKPGTQIGPYKLLQQIGEGGMGVVYMAEQTEPVQRKVALKVIKPGLDSSQVIARFDAEKQALALMDHVNIARVLDAGLTEQGRPYFVMELVHGVPITKSCDDNRLTPRQRLELFVPVCQAIQHAHQKGIIHRDIKPSNVMVTLYDGKPVPKVIDFGVAKATDQKLNERTLFTQYGTIIGTLEYMSPEQAEMSALGVDTRSDIYSLGVLLYELLTGSTPLSNERVEKAAYAEILRLIKEEEPPKPSTRLSDSGKALACISAQRQTEPAKLTKLLRGELDWIVMKTLEKDRNRRYESAGSLAADIQRYLHDEPVQACPPWAGYRLRKHAQRHKLGLATAGLILLSLVACTVVSTWQAIRAVQAERLAEARFENEKIARRRADAAESLAEVKATELTLQKQVAEQRRQLAEDRELTARHHHYAAQMNLAEQAWDSGNVARVLTLLEGQRPVPGQSDLRGFEWFYLWRHANLNGRRLRGHRGPVTSMAFSPDGRTLATGSQDFTARLWDVETGKELTVVASAGQVNCLAFSPDGKTLAFMHHMSVRLWDVTREKVVQVLGDDGNRGWLRGLKFSPDGNLLAAAGGGWHPKQGDIRVWNLATGQELFHEVDQQPPFSSVAFSPDGTKLAASRPANPTLTLWDVATGKRQASLDGHAGTCIVFSPNGESLASANDERTVRVWSVATRQQQAIFESSSGAIRSLAYSPDGQCLVLGRLDGNVTIWNPDSGHASTFGHGGPVLAVAFSPNGKTVASGSHDRTVALWDTTVEPDRNLIKLIPSSAPHITFSPDGKTLAYNDDGWTVRLWDTASRTEGVPFSGHSDSVPSFAFSPDGKMLASGSADRTARLWDTATGQERFILQGHTDTVQSVAFSCDGKLLATGSDDQTVKLWEVETGLERRMLRLELGQLVRVVAFSPNNQTLAAGLMDGTTRLWEVATGKALHQFDSGYWGWVRAIAFSPQGDRLAMGNQSGTLSIWNPETGQLLTRFSGHTAMIQSVAFFPDGGTMVSASDDGTLKLWDSATWHERGVLKGHKGPILSVTIAADSQSLATTSYDGTVRVWSAPRDRAALAFRSVELDPNHAESAVAFNNLGDLHRAAGRLPEAILAYRKSLSMLEDLAPALPQLSVEAMPAYQEELARALFHLGLAVSQSGRRSEAESLYERAFAVDPDNCLALNNAAWLLVTRPGTDARDARRAIQLAKRAVELSPGFRAYWNTLGVAHYRAGEWSGALAALTKSTELGRDDDAHDGFFLSMTQWQLGRQTAARQSYDRAVEWMEQNKPDDDGLLRFRQEAAELLGPRTDERTKDEAARPGVNTGEPHRQSHDSPISHEEQVP